MPLSYLPVRLPGLDLVVIGPTVTHQPSRRSGWPRGRQSIVHSGSLRAPRHPASAGLIWPGSATPRALRPQRRRNDFLPRSPRPTFLARQHSRSAAVLRCLALASPAPPAAHAAGVVHRDVKPGNLLLNSRGEVAVADFGVASAVGLDSMTMTGTVLGTAGYLSPEQAKGERATPASDRYALGVVAYELLTGERPFASDSATAEASAHVHAPIPYPSQHGDVPPELDPVLRRALAKDPADRYPSSADFVAALREALSHAAGTTRALAAVREEEYTPVAAPSKRPNPLVWVAAVILGLLALGAGLGMAGVLGDDEEPQTRTVVETQVTTEAGQPTTVRETVTTAPATTSEPTTTAAPPPPPPSEASGEALTDQATALLGQRRWAEAEAVARQALTKLEGSGELYEAYALYNLSRALVEQGRCDEALPLLDQSEQIQGSRKEIRQARKRCS